jgi:hypothetical protein
VILTGGAAKKAQKPPDKKPFQSAQFIDSAIKYLNKDGATPNRMPHFRASEKWPDQ